MLIDNQEVFLAFGDFPWFEHATIREIGKVERPSAQHLYWPALDIDLAVDSLHHPGAYPLVSKGAKQARPERTRSGRTGGRKSPRRA